MASRQKQDARKKEFKKTVDAESSFRRRQESSTSLRKNKREESLLKRRNFGAEEKVVMPVTELMTKLANLPIMVQKLLSGNVPDQLEAATDFRKLLSIENNPPIDQVVSTGVVPRLVDFLSYDAEPKVQFESAWTLTNIASGNSAQTKIVVESGAVQKFIQSLTHSSSELREQAVWAIGNIAGDSPASRDFVLQHGVVEPLLNVFQESSKMSMLKNATWAVSNLCRGKPQPDFDVVRKFLPVLQTLLSSSDQDVITDACWAISYLSDGSDEKIAQVMKQGVGRRLVDLLGSPFPSVQVPALRSVGNILTGDSIQTQEMVDLGCLPRIGTLMGSSKKGIVKESCWAISNVTAGTKDQIQAVFDANIIPGLIKLLHHADFDIKKEACWAISNTASCGSLIQTRTLVANGSIKPLCDLLTCADVQIVTVVLEALENILKMGEKLSKNAQTENAWARHVEEVEGLDKIEVLQEHQNEDIYDKAIRIIEKYFAGEETTSENISPNVNQQTNTFSFGTQVSLPQTGFSF